MAVAAKWAACNPGGASGAIKIPRLSMRFLLDEDSQFLERAFNDRLARVEREKGPLPEEKKTKMRAEIAEMRSHFAGLDEQSDEIRALKDELEQYINGAADTQQSKYDINCNGDEGITSELWLGRWYLAWAFAGHNVFELSNDFVAAMLLTDPREIHFDALRLPFPGVLITIPDRFVTGTEGRSYTKLHLSRVDGSWDLYATDDVHILNTRVAEGQKLSWDFFEGIETIKDDHELDAADATAIRSIRQIAFGMLAYVTAVDRAIEERPAAATKKRNGSDRTRPRVHDVGRSVKIDPTLVKYARVGAREIALQIKHRFIVRGHYRNQAYGPGHQDHKMIWIEPYWKGPEEGAKIMHTYKPETSS
jgi:hypothetical protein